MLLNLFIYIQFTLYSLLTGYITLSATWKLDYLNNKTCIRPYNLKSYFIIKYYHWL